MQKVRITLPATITLGPALNSLALAIGLHTTVEISHRADDSLIVEAAGEGSGQYGIGLRHPVVLTMLRVFQKQERAPRGVTVRIQNAIPVAGGLGAEAAFSVAGIIGANNLLDASYNRMQMLEMASGMSSTPHQTAASVIGGLVASVMMNGQLIHRGVPVQPLQAVIVMPDLPRYAIEAAKTRPDRILFNDVVYNLDRVPLLIEALRAGDLPLLGEVLDDRLRLPSLKPLLSGYDHVTEMARRAGASAVTLCGDGPALVAFAPDRHADIARTMVTAFENSGVKARSWVAPLDRQGVVISVIG
jgi:homoserine kinase